MKFDVILSKCLHTNYNQCCRSRIKRKWGMMPFDMSYDNKRLAFCNFISFSL